MRSIPTNEEFGEDVLIFIEANLAIGTINESQIEISKALYNGDMEAVAREVRHIIMVYDQVGLPGQKKITQILRGEFVLTEATIESHMEHLPKYKPTSRQQLYWDSLRALKAINTEK